MHRLLINLYELGQFLRLPFRRRQQLPAELLLSFEEADVLSLPSLHLSSAEISGNGHERSEHQPLENEVAVNGDEATIEPDDKEKIYKGILWMKEKYEQYRDMADRRYEQLKGELASYPDLLEEKNRQIAFLQQQLDQRIKNYHQSEIDSQKSKSRMLELDEVQLRARHLLEEKQAYIDELEGQLVAERQKIEELVTKLQASSQQLLSIYEELDKSLKPTNGHPTES
jgi:chromosome segregation ATPase